jgi:hypothetical protein
MLTVEGRGAELHDELAAGASDGVKANASATAPAAKCHALRGANLVMQSSWMSVVVLGFAMLARENPRKSGSHAHRYAHRYLARTSTVD